MPQCPIKQPAALLPHSGRMVLLDEVLSYGHNNLHAVAVIRPDCILLPAGATALPGWLELEIMAQGVGAWAGAQALDAGRLVQLGFLLGTRKLTFGLPEIPVGTVMDVKIELSWQDAANNMGVFDCELACRTPAARIRRPNPARHITAQWRTQCVQPLRPRSIGRDFGALTGRLPQSRNNKRWASTTGLPYRSYHFVLHLTLRKLCPVALSGSLPSKHNKGQTS